METPTQKLALSKSVQAEEQKVKSKRTTPIARKPVSGKAPQTKSRASLTVPKKTPAIKKEAKHVSREKIIRDSFTMPVEDYKLLAELKKLCLSKGIAVKKSELLRAGLKSLAQMNLTTLKKQLSELSEIKTGRPPKSSK